MPNYIKGTIGYINAIEQINRKFVPRKVKCTKSEEILPNVKTLSQGWMGGMTTLKYRAGLGLVSKNLVVVRQDARATQPSTDELAARAMFNTIAGAVRTLMKDLSQLTRIQRMYNEAAADLSKTLNGVRAYGYTLRGWVFAVQYAGRKENDQYNVNQFPSAFDA